MQLPLATPASDWRPPNLSELPSWAGAKRVSIDTETYDPYLKEMGPSVRRGGYVVGYSFSIEDGPSHYVPIRHQGGDNCDEEQALRYLRDQARGYRGVIAGANLSYDLDYLAQEGVDWPVVQFFRDVQIADPLIYELHSSYSLESIAQRWGFAGKVQGLLQEAARAFGLDPKGGLWRLPGRFVGPYGEGDAALPLRILRKQERRLEEEDLWGVYDLESKLMPVLVKMRRRGVRVDLGRLEYIENWSLQEEHEALKQVKAATGHDIGLGNLWKVDAVAPALEFLGIRLTETPGTGKKSIRKDVLEGIDHPVAKAIHRGRAVNKIRTTFAESIRRYLIGDRIHCSFNQMRREREDGNEVGAAYGRVSAEHPNMQQQPARDEELGPLWRSIYVPEEGETWACMDYSQQEPRMLVHYAVKAGAPGAIEARDNYRNNPKADSHQLMADMAGIKRSPAKIIFLGVCYGMGGGKLCTSLKLPAEKKFSKKRQREILVAGPEGQELLDTFDERLPFVRWTARAAEKRAKAVGFVRTLSGRRCRFPAAADGEGWDWTHKALNRVIQGSSADQVKKAMVDADAAGFRPGLQVHDELDASVPDRRTAEGIAQVMMNAYQLELPFMVDVEMGPNWGTLAK